MASKFDPLESAKVTDKKPSKKSKKDPMPMPPAVEEPAAAEPPATNRRYKVLEEKTIAIRGNITTVAKGAILSEQQYGGAKGIAAILSSGIKVEELD